MLRGGGILRRTSIRRVGPWSVFKFSLVSYLIFFLLVFVFFLISYLIVVGSGFAGAQSQDVAELFKVFGVSGGIALVIIFFAGILSCVFYAIFNSIGALIYNLIAWITGGIELGLEDKEEKDDQRYSTGD
jgi:hypothetical protein